MQSCCHWRMTYDIHTSSAHHADDIYISSACHEDNILMSSACHLHIQNLPELPNFMTWLVFICYIVSAESLILSLIFGWTLSVQDVLLISFGRKFCNLFLDQFGFEYCFWYMFCFDLICQFWVNSVYLLCCFNRKFFSIGIDINFDIWLNIIYSRCFIDIFW